MRYFRHLECFWERLKGSWDAFGSSWESPVGVSGASWQALGGILETLGRCFGTILGSEQHLRSDLLKFEKPSKT